MARTHTPWYRIPQYREGAMENWIGLGIGLIVAFVIILVLAAAVGKGCDRAIRMDEDDRFR